MVVLRLHGLLGHVPDILTVLAYRAVRGEAPVARHVEYGHTRPLFPVHVGYFIVALYTAFNNRAL